jgi:hypothetical protein
MIDQADRAVVRKRLIWSYQQAKPAGRLVEDRDG